MKKWMKYEFDETLFLKQKDRYNPFPRDIPLTLG
jgi:hypothetical protein